MKIAVDVGGTYTDLVFSNGSDVLKGYKSPTTPDDITQGVFDGLELIAADQRLTLPKLLEKVERFGFGTTTATNALLVGRTARTALITTKGFRDTLLIREGGKADSYDIRATYPAPFIPRSLTFEVSERMTAEGEVLRPLDLGSVQDAIDACREAGVEAIAVSLLWSIANPAHEREIGMHLARQLPEIPISLSHQVNPCIREYRRTSATAIDASLKPIVNAALARLERRLREKGFGGTLSYVTSNGGQTSAREVIEKPVYLCFSGPSAAPHAGKLFADLEGLDGGNVITADMGGTSFDVTIVSNGRVPMHRDGMIAGHVFGVPSVEIHTIGAGGGSIGWHDSGGFIHAGPDSAGSRPGPACYGRGGTRPTITDANMVCGCLGAKFTTGNGMVLDHALAVSAIKDHLADPLGLPVEQAAALMRTDSEQKMVVAIEDLTIKRGIDPRDFILISGGSATGMHAAALARELGIKKVLVPPMSGVLSAFGILSGNISFSFGEGLITTSSSFRFDTVNALLEKLESEATAYLERMEVPVERRQLLFSCQACYADQVWQLSVELPDRRVDGAAGLADLVEAFHKQHEQVYTLRSPDDAVEFSEWTVLAVGTSEGITIPEISTEGRQETATPFGKRNGYLPDAGGHVELPIYDGNLIPVGCKIKGPAVIEDVLTSVLLIAGSTATLTHKGSYIIDIDL